MAELFSDLVRAPGEAQGRWASDAWRIGVDVAAVYADDVDVNARFPHETIAALKESRVLAAMLPAELGGGDASLADMVAAVRALGAHCVSSALVLAMHCIEIVNLNRHGDSPGLRELSREVAQSELLIANANSEVGLGGDVGRSRCFVDTTATPWTLHKEALAISYGENADLLVATARNSPDAAETEQFLCVLRAADVRLKPISEWDTLGLRGTCSRGYELDAVVDPTIVFPVPFSVTANDGGGQSGQLLRSAAWVGIAESAASRAHAFVRAAARRDVGTTPPGALRVSEIAAELHQLRALLAMSMSRYEEFESTSELQHPGLITLLRNLKVASSQGAAHIATAALEVCGIAGLQRRSPFSLDRLIRDAHGGLVMVSNDRYLRDNSQLLLARKSL